MIDRKDKELIIKTLTEDLQKETNGLIRFFDRDSPTCISEAEQLVDKLLYLTKIRLFKKVLYEKKTIMLNGEIDFNEYKNITDKLLEYGFSKNNTQNYESKNYDEYCIGNDLCKVVIQKSEA